MNLTGQHVNFERRTGHGGPREGQSGRVHVNFIAISYCKQDYRRCNAKTICPLSGQSRLYETCRSSRPSHYFDRATNLDCFVRASPRFGRNLVPVTTFDKSQNIILLKRRLELVNKTPGFLRVINSGYGIVLKKDIRCLDNKNLKL